ncbi:MAG: peptidylprolyl isomerase [Planctomycetia bacterium]|nr:peptidylprolyl isomerase [Planctomycetia bacterium]
MTNRQAAIVAIVAAVLLVITILLYSLGGPPSIEASIGAVLIQGLAPEAIHKIVIKTQYDSATLVSESGGFVVAEKDNYPASVKQINDLLFKCLEIRTKEKISEVAANHAEFGVVEGEKGAVSIAFLDAEGKLLIGFVKGKAVDGSAGSYVRLLGKDAVFTTESALWLETNPLDYIDEKLISVTKDELASVEVRAGETAYTISRGDDGKVALQKVPKGKRAKQDDVDDVFRALVGLDMADVLPADGKAALAFKWDASYTAHLKSGLSYTLQLARDDEKHYARLSARGPKDETINVLPTDSQDELKKKEAVIRAIETARTFAPRHAAWVYEIPVFSADSLRRPFSDLFEDVPEEEAAKEIKASHILISYEGAQRTEAKRTKAEAKTLAEKVLKEVRADGADFAALAQKHSDGPSKTKGGDLGLFGKGKMAPAFDEASFKLKVGEISGIVETPFGFHIIKRTQ